MSDTATKLGQNFGAKAIQAAAFRLSDDGKSNSTADKVELASAAGTPSGAYSLQGDMGVLARSDAGSTPYLLAVSVDGGTSWDQVVTEAGTGRVGLSWTAGARGKPGINADILNATEATRMVTDPDFEILGTNASSDDVTFNAEGGIQIDTDGADGDEVILLPHLDTNQTAWTAWTWGTDKSVHWSCRIRSGAAITNCIIWTGLKLTNTEVKATDDDQVYFRYEDDVASGNWEVVSSIGGTDTSTDTSVAAAADTDYLFEIKIAADRTAQCYLNGSLVYTTAALTDEVDLIPYVGVAADGAAESKHIIIYGQKISRSAG